MISKTILWSWLRQLISGGLSEASIRFWAEKLAVMLGLNPQNFGNLILFLSRLAAPEQAQAEAWLSFVPMFSAPDTAPGETDAAGQHAPDLPENCNEFAPQLYQLRGALMESALEEESVLADAEESKSKKGKKPAKPTE